LETQSRMDKRKGSPESGEPPKVARGIHRVKEDILCIYPPGRGADNPLPPEGNAKKLSKQSTSAYRRQPKWFTASKVHQFDGGIRNSDLGV